MNFWLNFGFEINWLCPIYVHLWKIRSNIYENEKKKKKIVILRGIKSRSIISY